MPIHKCFSNFTVSGCSKCRQVVKERLEFFLYLFALHIED